MEDLVDWSRKRVKICSAYVEHLPCQPAQYLGMMRFLSQLLHFQLPTRHFRTQKRVVVHRFQDFRIVARIAQSCCLQGSSPHLFQSLLGTTSDRLVSLQRSSIVVIVDDVEKMRKMDQYVHCGQVVGFQELSSFRLNELELSTTGLANNNNYPKPQVRIGSAAEEFCWFSGLTRVVRRWRKRGVVKVVKVVLISIFGLGCNNKYNKLAAFADFMLLKCTKEKRNSAISSLIVC